jgi:hypothetical protein
MSRPGPWALDHVQSARETAPPSQPPAVVPLGPRTPRPAPNAERRTAKRENHGHRCLE